MASFNAAENDRDEPACLRRWRVLILALTLLYGGLHLLWYWQTPLGQVPVLDERENLDLAAQIASGTLPAEAFYRAMGYPLFLAGFRVLGVTAAAMPFAATAAGLGLHVLNAWLVGSVARRLFKRNAAALIAGLLYGLNPVLIHYATQLLDGTLASTAFLLGVLALVSTRPPRIAWPLAGLAWSLAALIRPQFLLIWPALPVAGWLLARERLSLRTAASALMTAVVLSAVPWLVQGTVQQRLSGTFRLMPTQGAYNLWAANRPGAHGRYFVQTVHLGSSDAHFNPTRVESEVLYTRETGRPATNFDEVNAYWNRRLGDAVKADPAGWLARMTRKTYVLLNDAEQYNNKTYAFHKARSPVLRFNPLGWGLLLLAGAVGFWVWLDRQPRAASAGLVIAVAVGASIVLAFVSARFRLPLVACLCVSAGGLAWLPSWWRQTPARQRWQPAALVVLCALLTFSRLDGVRSQATFVQDHLLSAAAAIQTGEDQEAWNEAAAALALAPGHPDALAWELTSYYNLLLTGTARPADEAAWADAANRFLRTPSLDVKPVLRVIAGIACWRAGNRDATAAFWRALATTTPDNAEALAALSLAGRASAEETAELLRRYQTQTGAPVTSVAGKPTPPPLVRMAIARLSSATDADSVTLRLWATRLFPETPPAPPARSALEK